MRERERGEGEGRGKMEIRNQGYLVEGGAAQVLHFK